MDIENCVKEYGKSLYSFCLYITCNKENADDLYQQTFLVAVEKKELEKNRNPKAYLIAIAMNLWKNRLRKAARRKRLAEMLSLEDEKLNQIPDGWTSVEREVEKKQEAERLRKCVLELPEKYKMVILLCYMEEMSMEEIARALRIPEGTVKSRLNKAKELLKERLRDGEY